MKLRYDATPVVRGRAETHVRSDWTIGARRYDIALRPPGHGERNHACS